MNSPSDSPADSHYFTESPSTASKRQQFSVVVAGRELILTADAGVFSQHGLDKGTAVLLDAMEKENPVALAPGSVLCDLGCGSGVIALALAVLYPECTILAVDVNERARNLCAENARTTNCQTSLLQSQVMLMSPLSWLLFGLIRPFASAKTHYTNYFLHGCPV